MQLINTSPFKALGLHGLKQKKCGEKRREKCFHFVSYESCHCGLAEPLIILQKRFGVRPLPARSSSLIIRLLWGSPIAERSQQTESSRTWVIASFACSQQRAPVLAPRKGVIPSPPHQLHCRETAAGKLTGWWATPFPWCRFTVSGEGFVWTVLVKGRPLVH